MFLLINSLLVLLNGSLQLFALSFFLIPKKKRIPNMLPYCLLLYITVFLKCVATNSLVSALFGFCNSLTFFCYGLLAFKNSFWEKIGKCILALGILPFTTEAVYSLFLKHVLHTTLDLNYYSKTMTLPLLLSDIFMLTTCSLFIFLIKLTKRIRHNHRFCLIAMFVFSQLIILATLFIVYLSDISENNIYISLISPIILIIANLFLVQYAISQEEKATANVAYRELQTLHQIEEAHYRELEQHSEALAKIRHDFHNQLATIHMLLQNENYTDAKEMALHMKELLDSVSASPSTRYCSLYTQKTEDLS